MADDHTTEVIGEMFLCAPFGSKDTKKVDRYTEECLLQSPWGHFRVFEDEGFLCL